LPPNFDRALGLIKSPVETNAYLDGSRGKRGSHADIVAKHDPWQRRRCFVEPAEGGGRARWLSRTPGGLLYEITRSVRDVLLAPEPSATFTRRATWVLAGMRSDAIGRVQPSGTVVSGSDDDLHWWTWAGYRVNATPKATLSGLADSSQPVH